MECICRNCTFYSAVGSQCRRWPPLPKGMLSGGDASARAVWPQVAPEDWCGEYREQTGEHRPLQAEL